MTNDSPLRAVAKPQDPIGLERGLQEPLYPEAGWTGFALYISPCAIRASNDPFTDEEIDAMEECARDFYGGCIEDIADLNTTGLFQMSTTFDYDLHYQTGANFNTTLAALEASMLEHLASMVGLSSCPQERVRELQFFESEISRFEGVSSLPLDRKDPHWDSCAASVASPIATASICEPLNGYFTFYLDNDPAMTAAEEAAIKSGMLQVIQSGMGNDVYVAGNVNQVVFVGTRAVDGTVSSAPDAAVGNVDEPEIGGNGKDGISGAGKGIIGAFGGLFLLLLMLAFTRRRQKDEVADEEASEPAEVEYIGERDLDEFDQYDSGDNIISAGSLSDKDTLALVDTVEASLPKKL